YSTLERAPKKTQNFPLTGRPSTTFRTSSRFPFEKNQNAPVSPVSGTACPALDGGYPAAFQETRAWKRPPFRQSVVPSAEQSACAVEDLAIAAGSEGAPPGKAAVSETLATLPCGLK